MAPSEMAHLDAPIRIAYLTYLDDPIRMGLSGWPIRMAYLASNLVRSARDGRRATPSGPGLMPHRIPHPIQSGHSWLSGHTVGRTFLQYRLDLYLESAWDGGHEYAERG